ncbi:MAG: hypothetical protein WC359_13825 [Dehalococcoidia bacterium]
MTSNRVTMVSRVAATGAQTVTGDDLTAIPGQRIIIDRISFSMQNGYGTDLTIDMRTWIGGAGKAFWAKIIKAGYTVSEEVPMDIILSPSATITTVWSDGISGYFTIFWRTCQNG